MSEKTKRLFWYETTGNPFLVSVNPLMLSKKGFELIRHLQPARGLDKEPVKVKYNRDFVVEAICSQFFEPLRGIDYDAICDLIQEAWDYFEWCSKQNLPTGMKESYKRMYLRERFKQFGKSVKS